MKRSGRITMKDIAEKAGCTVNTVSLALNGGPTTEKTRTKVLAVAEELGYIGNSIARSMRSGSTKNIAIIVGDIGNLHFARIIKRAVNMWSAHTYNAIIYNTDERGNYEKSAIISAIQQNVAGILISPVMLEDKNLDIIKKSGIPFVAFGCECEDSDISNVTMNDVKAGEIATDYLIQRGHKKIVFVNSRGSRGRLKGFMNTMQRHGLEFPMDNILTFDPTDESLWVGIQYKLCYQLDFTGVIAFNDMVGMRLYQLFQGDNFQTNRISCQDIVAFDNIFEEFCLPINIPSVGHSSIELADAAPRLLLNMIETQSVAPKEIILDVKLYLH